jgi:hypothetical protein
MRVLILAHFVLCGKYEEKIFLLSLFIDIIGKKVGLLEIKVTGGESCFFH